MSPIAYASGSKLGLTVFSGFLLAAALVCLPLIWTDSPVVERDSIPGQIVGAAPSSVSPYGIIRTGLEIEYVVELPEGLRIRIKDGKARRLGSWALVERATRENGSQFYTFARPPVP